MILRGNSDSLAKQHCRQNICDLLCAVCCSIVFIKCVITHVKHGRGTFPDITPDHCVAVRKRLRLDVKLVSLSLSVMLVSFVL